jgi:hypothetical protein
MRSFFKNRIKYPSPYYGTSSAIAEVSVLQTAFETDEIAAQALGTSGCSLRLGKQPFNLDDALCPKEYAAVRNRMNRE